MMGRVRNARRTPGTTPTRRQVSGRLAVAAALMAALTATLTGCSTPDNPREDLRHTVRRVSMTMAGAAMTVDALERLPATVMTADLALADAVARVDEAEHRILLLDIRPGDEPTRGQALRLVREAADELADTQAWVTGVDPDQPAPTPALRDLANRLLELSDEMAATK